MCHSEKKMQVCLSLFGTASLFEVVSFQVSLSQIEKKQQDFLSNYAVFMNLFGSNSDEEESCVV